MLKNIKQALFLLMATGMLGGCLGDNTNNSGGKSNQINSSYSNKVKPIIRPLEINKPKPLIIKDEKEIKKEELYKKLAREHDNDKGIVNTTLVTYEILKKLPLKLLQHYADNQGTIMIVPKRNWEEVVKEDLKNGLVTNPDDLKKDKLAYSAKSSGSDKHTIKVRDDSEGNPYASNADYRTKLYSDVIREMIKNHQIDYDEFILVLKAAENYEKDSYIDRYFNREILKVLDKNFNNLDIANKDIIKDLFINLLADYTNDGKGAMRDIYPEMAIYLDQFEENSSDKILYNGIKFERGDVIYGRYLVEGSFLNDNGNFASSTAVNIQQQMNLEYVPVAANYIGNTAKKLGFNSFNPQIAGNSYKSDPIGPNGASTTNLSNVIDFDNAVIEYTFSKGKTVHFLLDGLNIEDAFNKDSPNYNAYTSHELRFIRENWDNLHSTYKPGKALFYLNNQNIPAPWANTSQRFN